MSCAGMAKGVWGWGYHRSVHLEGSVQRGSLSAHFPRYKGKACHHCFRSKAFSKCMFLIDLWKLRSHLMNFLNLCWCWISNLTMKQHCVGIFDTFGRRLKIHHCQSPWLLVFAFLCMSAGSAIAGQQEAVRVFDREISQPIASWWWNVSRHFWSPRIPAKEWRPQVC